MSYLEFKDKRANSVDPDEVAHDEPPQQELPCLQIQLFSSLVFKALTQDCTASQCCLIRQNLLFAL